MHRLVFSTTIVLTLFALIHVSHGAELEHGAAAPKFTATDVDGKPVSLDDAKDSKVLVVCFTCTTCPVVHAYEDRINAFYDEYHDEGVEFIAINDNYTDSLDEMKSRAKAKRIKYTYAFDGSGKSARAFGALSTPHFFVFDKDQNLVYSGAFDNDWEGLKTSEHYVKSVVDSLLGGEEPKYKKTKAVGCSIRLK